MATIDDLVSNLKNAVTNLSQITVSLKAFFPQQTTTTSFASPGTATLPANPAGFITVTLQNGSTVQVPFYNP